MKKSTVANAVIVLVGLFLSIILTLDLMRISVDVSSVKYIPIVLFAAVLVFFHKGNGFGDPISLVGLLFFFGTTAIFTLINDLDLRAMLALAGYLICVVMYVVASKNDGTVGRAVGSLILVLAILFSSLNLTQIWNAEAYTIQKNQFSGLLINPNYFSGLSG